MVDSLLIACSGENAWRVILEAQIYAMTLVYVSWGIVLCTLAMAVLRRGAVFGTFALLGLMICHPAYWTSATGGDCGDTLRAGATIWTLLIAGCAAWVWRRTGRLRPATNLDAA